jgi:hypothetical protein
MMATESTEEHENYSMDMLFNSSFRAKRSADPESSFCVPVVTGFRHTPE